MLSQSQRTAILELCRQGVGQRRIAQELRLSRASVKKVIGSQSVLPPILFRAEKAEAYRQQILERYAACQGNLVRVHEDLLAAGAQLSYPALTAFCRRQGIGSPPKKPAGRYDFQPGEEIQHDTSPHKVRMDSQRRIVQTASAVLCYSHMLFFQCYPTFKRFDAKVFLTEALKYFNGSCRQVMIDNTHVIILRGTGPDMIPAAEMAAFAERYGFQFCAHRIGDANRSGRVERPFSFIENNFLVGREFTDWNDLNQQARLWCDRVNRTYKKHMRAVPSELFALERTHLKPLPLWVPEVYRLHHRIVDVEGYVCLQSHRYSAPWAWIGHPVEVRESKDRIEIQYGLRQSVSHQRLLDSTPRKMTLPEHRPPRGQAIKKTDPRPEEKALLQLLPEMADYLIALKKCGRPYITLALRQLLRLTRQYPKPAILSAVSEAAHYGLYDLDRLERMILRRIAHDFFPIHPPQP